MRALEFLFEYDLNKINNLMSLIDQRKTEDKSLPKFNQIKELADLLQNTYHLSGEYIFWILHRYANKLIGRWEDVGARVIPALAKYQKLKNKKKITGSLRDINQIKSLSQLEDLFDQFPDEELVSNKEQDKEVENEFYKSKQATLLYNDVDIKVVIPHTKAASCYFGKNTRWCTAAKEHNAFDYYNNKGSLYIVLIKKENKRYQFSFGTDQFMNEQDKEINPIELADRYPKLWDIFTPIAEKEKSLILNKNPSEQVKLAAVKNNGYAISHIKNPSEEVQLAAVKQNGLAIHYIDDPSEQVKLAAVKENGYALKYINNPSDEIKLASVSQHGCSIQFIDNPSKEVKMAAVKSDGLAIQHIKNPSKEVKMAAVKSDGLAIQHIKNPSPALQVAAVTRDYAALRYIKNPCDRALLIAS